MGGIRTLSVGGIRLLSEGIIAPLYVGQMVFLPVGAIRPPLCGWNLWVSTVPFLQVDYCPIFVLFVRNMY